MLKMKWNWFTSVWLYPAFPLTNQGDVDQGYGKGGIDLEKGGGQEIELDL